MSSKLPAPPSCVGGELAPLMDAKSLRQMATRVFRALGGEERLILEANEDSDSYKWFMEKVFMKSMPRGVELEAGVGVEELLARLDAGEHATIINGEAKEVT